MLPLSNHKSAGNNQALSPVIPLICFSVVSNPLKFLGTFNLLTNNVALRA